MKKLNVFGWRGRQCNLVNLLLNVRSRIEKDLTVLENGIIVANGACKCGEKYLSSKRGKITDKLTYGGAGIPVCHPSN